MRRLVWRLTISVGLIAVLLAGCSRLRQVDHATIALLMVLSIVALAKVWGSAEALAAAIAGGFGFDYYFLPPKGFGIEAPEHWVALIAFLMTAVVTGQLAAQLKRRRVEAEQREADAQKLYRLANSLLDGSDAEATTAQLADKVAEIFGADGVALYDKHSGQIVRSGPRNAKISDVALHETVVTGRRRIEGPGSAYSIAAIRHGAALVGSIGISGANISETLLTAVAGRVGLGLARMHALEKATEAEVVRRSEELKSAVLDAMAHEIRNPLNSIKLAATTLLSGRANRVSSDGYGQEMLTIIDEEVDRMDRSIDAAVQLARAEANELTLRKEPEDVARLIPASIAEMGAAAARRQIHVQVPESLPPADCDRSMILRVLKQLLNNALKYSPADSPVTVAAECAGAAIVIQIIDHGPGVPEEERERIFEKYYRGRAAGTSVPGNGLGLASAKSIVQAHGGKIWVTASEGGGATFHVSLPAARARQAAGVN